MKPGTGPIPARVMIVGEAWGKEEERQGAPFVGASGHLLNSMLAEVGLDRSTCRVTNLINARPPDNDLGHWIAVAKKDVTATHVPLRDKFVLPLIRDGYNALCMEVEHCKPNVIIALGNYAMWALTGKWGILHFRGSQLSFDNINSWLIGVPTPKVLPTIHPAAILREWPMRTIALHDLRRAASHQHSREYEHPKWSFLVRPNFTDTLRTLDMLLHKCADSEFWIDFDLETKSGHIDCVGLSWSKTDAICIPIMARGKALGYWSEEEEAEIVYRLYKLLTHPRIFVRGQNLLYDCQYTYRDWGFVPRVQQDTMISQHCMMTGMKKSLDFQASLYCDYYVQWKPKRGTWKEGG